MSGVTNAQGVSAVDPSTGYTFTNPKFTGIRIGDSYPLTAGGIPLIGLSSGSVAAGGAISAITALPYIVPAAYCYFPANILAPAIAAGWYYCTFSSTTAGTAFLNTYTSDTPTIPASPTAVTAGQGAFTGDTGEEFGVTITLPANSLGTTGRVRVIASTLQTSNANAKTLRLRWSGNAGTIFMAQPGASVSGNGFVGSLINTGATNQNVSTTEGASMANMTTASAVGTVDTTAASTIVLSIQRGIATDNLMLMPPSIEVVRAV